MSDDNEPIKVSLDIFGFGEVAKAIPEKVYEQTADAALTTLKQLISPLTALTSGTGRYLTQKFDNMVDAEKAVAVYTMQKAIHKAKQRCAHIGIPLSPPQNTKVFVRTVEEASKEADPLLHEMWTNLLAAQFTDIGCHPHFVESLTHFSPEEAHLLIELLPIDSIGENSGGFIGSIENYFTHWLPHANGNIREWSISCTLLCDFNFANVAGPKSGKPERTAILYRTHLGSKFLEAVSNKSF